MHGTSIHQEHFFCGILEDAHLFWVAFNGIFQDADLLHEQNAALTDTVGPSEYALEVAKSSFEFVKEDSRVRISHIRRDAPLTGYSTEEIRLSVNSSQSILTDRSSMLSNFQKFSAEQATFSIDSQSSKSGQKSIISINIDFSLWNHLAANIFLRFPRQMAKPMGGPFIIFIYRNLRATQNVMSRNFFALYFHFIIYFIIDILYVQKKKWAS